MWKYPAHSCEALWACRSAIFTISAISLYYLTIWPVFWAWFVDYFWCSNVLFLWGLYKSLNYHFSVIWGPPHNHMATPLGVPTHRLRILDVERGASYCHIHVLKYQFVGEVLAFASNVAVSSSLDFKTCNSFSMLIMSHISLCHGQIAWIWYDLYRIFKLSWVWKESDSWLIQ